MTSLELILKMTKTSRVEARRSVQPLARERLRLGLRRHREGRPTEKNKN